MMSDNMGSASDSYWQNQKVDTIMTQRAHITRLADMLRTCVTELRSLDARTIPQQAENLLAELGY
jgi:hypothetical protein